MQKPNDQTGLEEVGKLVIELLKRRRARQGPDGQPARTTAIQIARMLNIMPHGERESRRRRVRKVIHLLKQQGQQIGCDGNGHWWMEFPYEHAYYQNWLRKQAIRQLATAARDKRSPAAAEAAGQTRLF